MRQPLLSVIIPVFNEQTTILDVVRAVRRRSKIKSLEIIVVDDGSSDQTWQILTNHRQLITTLIKHPQNLGKGAAIKSGLQKAKGKIVVIQDADLEYDPINLKALIQPIIDQRADAVYGSRFVSSEPRRVLYFWHFIANQFLTLLTNLMANLNISDMETGYKAISRDLFLTLPLKESGFGIEPEITIRLSQAKARIYEVGVSYHGRSYEEGKKIQLIDAVKACFVIIKITCFSPWSITKIDDNSQQTQPKLEQVFAAPWRISNEIHQWLCRPWVRLDFLLSGIKWESGHKFYGWPILQRWRGSKIKIGANLELRSTFESNPLSPNHPVVISTRSPQAKLEIGDHFSMTGGSIIAENKIIIGSHVMIGANCLIMDTDFHPLDPEKRMKTPLQGRTAPVIIEDNVFVGANSIILKGTKIGRRSVIGAGSVATGTIESNCIVSGNPLRLIRKI